MYILLALMSAFFSSMTAILGKKALSSVNSNIATFLRTGIVLVYVWGFVFAIGAHTQIFALSHLNIVFLGLSGIATGGSWLCYYKALSIGSVSRVTVIDKSSVILTMIFGMLFLGESVTALKVLGLVLVGSGVYVSIGRAIRKGSRSMPGSLPGELPKGGGALGGGDRACLIFASFSAVFASLTSIFAKVGLQDIDANLGTAVRTGIVLLFAGLMLPVTGSSKKWGAVKKKDMLFLCLSALATSLAWLSYFNALRLGEVSVVAPVDKLSIVITIGLSAVLLKERISMRAWIGVFAMTLGAVVIVL